MIILFYPILFFSKYWTRLLNINIELSWFVSSKIILNVFKTGRLQFFMSMVSTIPGTYIRYKCSPTFFWKFVGVGGYIFISFWVLFFERSVIFSWCLPSSIFTALLYDLSSNIRMCPLGSPYCLWKYHVWKGPEMLLTYTSCKTQHPSPSPWLFSSSRSP